MKINHFLFPAVAAALILASCKETDSDKVKVSGLVLTPSSLSLEVGETQTLSVTVLPEDASNKSVTWKSSDSKIASVSKSGEVTGVADGDAVVSAVTKDGGFIEECEVSVYDPNLVPDNAPAAYGVVPSKGQVAWQRQELIMFYHFGPATFSGKDGDASGWNYNATTLANAYQPTAIDADQWVKVAADNGFKEVILTAKHHDGFCLWDNPTSTCDVAALSGVRGTDVVKAVSDAAAKYGLNFGIYMSPWDRINGSSSNYANNYITAIHSVADGQYGTLTEFWLDGHNANGLNFTNVNNAILEHNPDCVIFSNVGPGCRWVGNESGSAGESCWSTFSPSSHSATQMSLPGNYESYLSQGDRGGTAWIPAECDFSIQAIGDSNGWFWGSSDSRKTASQLMQIYYTSVGRNSIFLMNVPPSSSGVIDDREKTVIEQFTAMRNAIFATNLAAGATVTATNERGKGFEPAKLVDGRYDSYFATADGATTTTIELTLDGEKTFNRLVLQEYIPLGQRVTAFTIQCKNGNNWSTWGNGTKSTIGHKRIILGSRVTTSAVRINITGSLACPVLNEIGLYNDTVSGI